MESSLGSDLNITKAFDMKIKQKELDRVVVDENTEKLRRLFILKAKRIYLVNIATKNLTELSFSKNHLADFITGNSNGTFLLIGFHNEKVFALKDAETPNQKIIYFKNLKLTAYKNTKYYLFANEACDKAISINDSSLHLWVKISEKEKAQKKLKEFLGYTTCIQLDKERKNLISDCKNYVEDFCVIFGNNYYYGSFAKVFYIIVLDDNKLNATKVYLVSYLFRFEVENKFRAEKSNEYKKYFDSKYVYSYIVEYNVKPEVLNINFKRDNTNLYDPKKYETEKNFDKTVVAKSTTNGHKVAVVINNCPNEKKENKDKFTSKIRLFVFSTENYVFNSFALEKYVDSAFPRTTIKIIVTDISWIHNDLFLLIQFSNYTFIILDANFSPVSFTEGTRYIAELNTKPRFYILSAFSALYNATNSMETPFFTTSNALVFSSTNPKTNYFLMFTPSYSICFYYYTKKFEARLVNKPPTSFRDFVLQTHYIQSGVLNEYESLNVLDNLHNFIFNIFNIIFKQDLESIDCLSSTETQTIVPKENNGCDPIELFMIFVSIFRHINLEHNINLSMLSYFICISNDFFFYLLSCKEIWLSFMFMRLCEKYLLKRLKLKNSRNKNYDVGIFKNQPSFLVFNPYISENQSLRCYNKISNRIYHSKFRLLLLLYSLIEFHNSQALNINVLYFVLSKLILDKLKRRKLLEDINLVLKIIIRNWKFLKTENEKAGSEEYVLNGFTFNYRNELLSHYTAQGAKNFRTDLSIDFFKDFYSADDLNNFNDLNELYCKGEEENLINEYGYANNIGVIQKWILFFVNFFYNDMFDDIKLYLTNYLKQTESKDMTKTESITPEEVSLSKLVFYNIYFFINLLQIFCLKLLDALTDFKKKNYLGNFSKNLVLFISPVDVPFIIFEFYSNVTAEMKEGSKNYLPFNICNFLFELFERYCKEISMTLLDGIEFCEFLILKGFSKESKSKLQNYCYSLVMFIFATVCKMQNFCIFRKYKNFLLSAIKSLDNNIKKDLLFSWMLILDATLQINDDQEAEGILKTNSTYMKNNSLELIKELFYLAASSDEEISENIVYFLKESKSKEVNKILFEEGMHVVIENIHSLIKDDIIDTSINDTPRENATAEDVFSLLFDKKYESEIQNIFNKTEGSEADESKKKLKSLILTFLNLMFLYGEESGSGFPGTIESMIQNIESQKDKLLKRIHEELIKFVYALTFIDIKVKLLKMMKEKKVEEYLNLYIIYLLYTKDRTLYEDQVNSITQYIIEANKSSKLTQPLINILFTNVLFSVSNTAFMNKIDSIIVQNENITLEFEKTSKFNFDKFEEKYQSSTIAKFIILYNNSFYKQIVDDILQKISDKKDILKYPQENNLFKNLKNNMKNFLKIINDLTGVPENFSIYLSKTFQYKERASFFDIFNSDCSTPPSTEGLDLGLLMMERQKKKKKKLKKKEAATLESPPKIDPETFEIAEECISKKPPKIKVVDNSKNYSSNSSLINGTQKIINKHMLRSFLRKIKRIFYYRFISAMFFVFKKEFDEELEQVEVLKISSGEIESTMLREKYISSKDIEYMTTKEKEISKYDILKLNKIRMGRGNQSKIYKALLKQKHPKKISDMVRSRIRELKMKIDIYEEMTNELGKNFVCNVGE